MVCQQLDELEWDFVQARAESCDIDSLGWTDREFSCLVAILDHKREGHQREPCLRDQLSFGADKPGFQSGPFDISPSRDAKVYTYSPAKGL
jgi:hypothetical protein